MKPALLVTKCQSDTWLSNDTFSIGNSHAHQQGMCALFAARRFLQTLPIPAHFGLALANTPSHISPPHIPILMLQSVLYENYT